MASFARTSLRTPAEISRALARLFRGFMAGEIDPKRASTAAYLLQVMSQVKRLEIDEDLGRRMGEIEEKLGLEPAA